MADDALVAVLSLQIGMLAEKVCDLDRLRQQGTRPVGIPTLRAALFNGRERCRS